MHSVSEMLWVQRVLKKVGYSRPGFVQSSQLAACTAGHRRAHKSSLGKGIIKLLHGVEGPISDSHHDDAQRQITARHHDSVKAVRACLPQIYICA